jgi:hypothetical protein
MTIRKQHDGLFRAALTPDDSKLSGLTGPVLHRFHNVVRSSLVIIGDDWGVEVPVRVELL